MNRWKEKKWIQLIINFKHRMKSERLDVFSAQASFYLIMSAIPILMLMVTLLKFTPLTQEMVMDAMAEIVNQDVMSSVQEMINNVYDGSNTLVSFAAISVLWVAGKGILGLMNGLNNIHQLKENRTYFFLRLRASVYTVLLVVAFIVAAAILVFGFRFQEYMCELLPFLLRYQKILIYLQTLIALCLLAGIFTALYVFLPNRKKTFASQIPGAVFATLSWCVFSYGFSIYLGYAKNMSVIYGGLVTLVVAMLWLYFCMYLWFIGAEINALLEDPQSFLRKAADDLIRR